MGSDDKSNTCLGKAARSKINREVKYSCKNPLGAERRLSLIIPVAWRPLSLYKEGRE